jgi:hypothetical protein
VLNWKWNKQNAIFLLLVSVEILLSIALIVGWQMNPRSMGKLVMMLLLGFSLIVLFADSFRILILLVFSLVYEVNFPIGNFSVILQDFILFGLLFSLLGKWSHNPRMKWRRHPGDGFAFLLAFSGCVSLVAASCKGWGSAWVIRQTINLLEFIFLVLITERLVQINRNLIFLGNCLVGTGILLAVYSLFCFIRAGGFDVVAQFSGTHILTRIRGGMDANNLAGFLDLLVPVGLTRFLTSKDQNARLWFLTSFMIMLSVIILTLSRGSWIAQGLVLPSLFLGFKGFRKKIMVPIIITIGLLSLASPIIIARIAPLFSYDPAAIGRIPLMLYAWKIFMLQPLWGVGFSNFAEVKFLYKFPLLWDPYRVCSAHNIYFELLVSLGFVGALAFILLVRVKMQSLRNILRLEADAPMRGLILGVLGSISAFLIHGFVDSFLANPITLWMLAILLGMAGGLATSQMRRG